MTTTDGDIPGDPDELIPLNGVDAETGRPLASLSQAQARSLALGQPLVAASPGLFRRFWERLTQPIRGLPDDSEPTDLTSVGWAVVFASDTPAEVRAAVEPLIAHRRDHTGVPADRLKVLEWPAGRPLEDWLRSIRAHAADVEPTVLPYYVLLVASPGSISFVVQAELDVHYAVGRLWFPEPRQYQSYVQSLIESEVGRAAPRGREVVYWGTEHTDDRATQLSARCLVRPLYEGVPDSGKKPVATDRGFRSRLLVGADATRANLGELLHPNPSSPTAAGPAFLFTASHGMGWTAPNPRQGAEQGALICQDWPGYGTRPEAEHCLGANAVADDARVHGLVAFLFACYGAGTPANDQFLHDRSQPPRPIADAPFVAALPQRLLSHPNGGALAVIGHVERAWGYSIQPRGLGTQLSPFRNLLGRVLKGEPVGHATKDFSDRYVSKALSIQNATTGLTPTRSAAELVADWFERNDAQNYVLLGDPGVRLRVESLI